MSYYSDMMIEMQDLERAEKSDEETAENIIYDDYDEEEQDYIDNYEPVLMADGTDISGLQLNDVEFIKPSTLEEINRWYKAYEVKEKCFCNAIQDKYVNLLANGYLFPDYATKYWAYIIKVNYYFKAGNKYYNLFLTLGNGDIINVSFNIDDSEKIITKALKNYFCDVFTDEDLNYKLVRVQVENRISRNGKKYTKILKFRIFDDDFENNLGRIYEHFIK